MLQDPTFLSQNDINIHYSVLALKRLWSLIKNCQRMLSVRKVTALLTLIRSSVVAQLHTQPHHTWRPIFRISRHTG